MARPDVRVKLSAEGTAEVVQALKRIQTEGQKASTKSKAGFGGLNKTLGMTRNLIGGLGIAVGFVTFKRMIGGAIEAADQINKLGAKVGATTEHLSALQLVARTADADLNQVGAALVRMNKNIGDAAAGIPTAVGFLRDLELGLSDFKGKDSVETFELISKRLFGLEDQLTRNRVAIGLFGRAGANLLPTMKALADEGLAAVIRRAEELGVLIDHDLAAASEQIKDDVEILKMQSEAIGINFMAGFGPEMSQMLQTLSGDIGQNATSWKDLGQGIGIVMKFIVAVVGSAFDYVGTYLGLFTVKISAGINALKAMLRGAGDEAKKITDDAEKYILRTKTDLEKRIAGRFDLATAAAPPATGTADAATTAGAEGVQEAAELAARRARALRTSLDREIALVKLSAKTKTKAEQREFENALQSVDQYYKDRRQILEDAYAAEVAKLEEKRGTIEAETDPAIRAQEEAKVITQLGQAKVAYEGAVADLIDDELKTVRALGQERLEYDAKVLEMQGKRIEAERLGFDEQIRKYDELLRKEGEGDAGREAAVARFRTALEAGADFDEAKTAAEDALTELGQVRADIDAQGQAGLISQLDVETQLLELEQSRLETLRALAEAMLEAAQATGDPEKIEQAQTFAASINAIAYNLEASTNVWTQFKTTALDSAQSALTEFFDTGISGSGSLKDKFKEMGAAIVQSLKRIAAELLAAKLMKMLGGFFSSGGQVDADFIGPMPAASGGHIRGRGTGTSDSILARLSDGEYVVRAASVSQGPVLEHLKAINRYGARALQPASVVPVGSVQRFAEGGLVDSARGEGSTVDGTVTLGLEDGLVAREIETPAGQRVIIRTITENRRAIRSALGI